MNSLLRRLLLVLPLATVARAAPSFDDSMQAAADKFRTRAEQAAADLNRTRARIDGEKAPLLRQLRAAEDRIIAAESEATRLETQRENAGPARQELLQDLVAVRKTTTYVVTLAHDGLQALSDGMAPGEDQRIGGRLRSLQAGLDDGSAGASGSAAMDAAEFLLARTEQALGGYRADGSAVLAETNQVVAGTFAFVGPETYFLPAAGGAPGTVRPRGDARYPIRYPLADWKPDAARAFFSGQPAPLLADASGGKALRLAESQGGVYQHIQKGGLVAFVIVFVGLVAALMILQKARELRGMAPDLPETVDRFLELVASGDLGEAEKALPGLRPTTRELYAVGLRNLSQPPSILEERLQAVLLEQRLHYEHRLSLLAVIATAAPLMGLLGTVVGMVKTFALITVFGTGNAGRLSSGISEVLVSTELGLAVAIPTLVVHGFLAQRVHRNLARLERCALQFATAAQERAFAAGGARRPA